MTKSTTKTNAEPMTNEEVEKVAAYVRRLVDGAEKRATQISPWILFEVGGFGRWFSGRFEGVSTLPARGISFEVSPRYGRGDDGATREIESSVSTAGQNVTPANAMVIASSLNSIALAVVDLEAVANELLRISNASATHRTIVDNVIEGWSNRGAA